MPSGACDAHLHVFDDHVRYPLAAQRHYTPALCRLGDYRRTARVLGIERAVVVQPSVYGFDNRALLDALAEGAMDARGVVVVGPDIPDTELDRMHALGVRGVRANVVNANGLGADDALRLAPRLKARGWHLQLQVEIGRFDGLDEFVTKAALPVVIDHFGLPASSDPDAPAFARLARLVAAGQCWVKLSGYYRFPAIDAAGLARALARANPERLLWASDWPHPGLGRVPMPDDAELLDQFGAWFPDAAMRRQVLVENPVRLYWT
jgi:predicted TIM-barrel fold metal-dependent hydrolase